MIYYTIYKITNLVNDKIYIGKHQTSNPYDEYFGSGKLIKKAIKKYGKSNFIKEVLFIFENASEMDNKEKELITDEFVANKNTYNMGVGGEGGPHFKGKRHSESTKKILKEKRMSQGKNILSDEGRKRIIRSNKTRVIRQETKEKISQKAKLRYSDEKFLEKFKDSCNKRPPKKNLSEETKRKISESVKRTLALKREEQTD